MSPLNKQGLLLLLCLIAIITTCFFFLFQRFPSDQTEFYPLAFVFPHNPLFNQQISQILSQSTLRKVETIVVLGPNHKDAGPHIISLPHSLTEKLEISVDENLVRQEHSFTVLEPLIRFYYPQAKIIPFIFRRGLSLEKILSFGQKLKSNLNLSYTLIIASVDFAHYLGENEARKNDQETWNSLSQNDYYQLRQFGPEHLDCPDCLITLLELIKEQKAEPGLLNHTYKNGTSYFFLAFLKQPFKDQYLKKITLQFNPTLSPTLSFSPLPVSQKITLAAVGDIGLGRDVNWQIQKRHDPTFPFQETSVILKKADLTLGNLEGPLIENCPLTKTGMVFCGQPQNAEGLAFAGFDLVNLANNHIKDWGSSGIQETRDNLSRYHVDYFGLDKIAYQKIKGTTIAFLGLDDTVQPIGKDELREKIQEAKNGAELVVVNFHWGAEYQKRPNERQKYLAHLAIDSGADLIIGHHPHILQPREFYQGKPIIYSLGNFVFDQPWSQETRTGAIVLITFENNQVLETDFIPLIIQESYQPQPLPEPEKSDIVNQYWPSPP